MSNRVSALFYRVKIEVKTSELYDILSSVVTFWLMRLPASIKISHRLLTLSAFSSHHGAIVAMILRTCSILCTLTA
jgi:hypothetical protein